MGPEIDVHALSQLSSENLRVLLRKIPGSKDLIIEPPLIPPLDKIAGMSLIKSCGVDRVFKLEQQWPDASAASTKARVFNVIYKFLTASLGSSGLRNSYSVLPAI